MARMRSWLSGLSLRYYLYSAGVVVLLCSGLFGGLDEATPDEPGVVKVAAQTEAAPFRLTFERARWSTKLTEKLASDRGRFLIIVAKVENTSGRTVSAGTLQEAVRLDHVPGIFKGPDGAKVVPSSQVDPQVLVKVDGSSLGPLNPGLHHEVAFVWEQRGAEEPPTSLRLRLRTHTWRESSIDEQLGWFDPTTYAGITLPVTEVTS